MKPSPSTVATVLALSLSSTNAQSSCGPAPSGSIQPSVASGYSMQVVATGLSKPRGILLDQAGNLLVVEAGRGVVSGHTLQDNNGCVSVQSSSDVTPSMNLNHGIEMSSDGQTLYASSSENVFSWKYDQAGLTVGNNKTLVQNMAGTDHTTRTLLLSQKAQGMLVVTRGSTSNIDFESSSLSSGHSQVKAFDISNEAASIYDYDTTGVRLGWGLRNDVGVAEHPNSGGIYTVENSADEITRMGVDVHQDNPAEELNFLGYLNGTERPDQGGNYGYPWCFSAWGVDELPDNGNLTVGSQFAIDASSDSHNENRTDAYCAAQLPARLVFQAHMAPLDIKFNNSGTEAWVTFHGSWDRTDPVGYKMSVIAFQNNGEPVDSLQSKTAATDIFVNQDNSKCPGDCFRPVGMTIDPQGRIFVSSDASGEIYLITKTTSGNAASGGSATASTGPSATSSSSSSTSSASAESPNAADSLGPAVMTASWFILVALVFNQL